MGALVQPLSWRLLQSCGPGGARVGGVRALDTCAASSGWAERRTIDVAVITDHVEKGWIASVPELRALAQGETRDEAVENLLSLIRTYPEALDELRRDTQSTTIRDHRGRERR